MNRKDYITDNEVIERANAAVRFAVEKKKITNVPVTAYDRKTKTIYTLNADGTRTTVKTVSNRGRFSERNSNS